MNCGRLEGGKREVKTGEVLSKEVKSGVRVMKGKRQLKMGSTEEEQEERRDRKKKLGPTVDARERHRKA